MKTFNFKLLLILLVICFSGCEEAKEFVAPKEIKLSFEEIRKMHIDSLDINQKKVFFRDLETDRVIISASDSVFQKAQSIGKNSYAFAGTRITNDSLIIEKIARFETTLNEQFRSERNDGLLKMLFTLLAVVVFIVLFRFVFVKTVYG